MERTQLQQKGHPHLYSYMGYSLFHLLSAGCLHLFLQPPHQA